MPPAQLSSRSRGRWRITPCLLLGGLIKFNTGQYAQAESSINRFLAAVPDHLHAGYWPLSVALQQSAERYRGLKPLVADHPEDLIARQMLAGAYLRQGDMASATAMFQELANSPNRAMAARARATLSLLRGCGCRVA